jgi:molecular chaperone DnaK
LSESLVLGLDFGTSTTAAAWVDKNGSLRVVRISESAHSMPSVVHYPANGEPVVGEPARPFLADAPDRTVSEIKRFLGRRFLSDFVGRHRNHVAYRLAEDTDGTCAIEVAGVLRPASEVTYEIVKRVIELATIAAGGPFGAAVVAVPANFTQRQRSVLREIVERAGLRVRSMINEPTAAALFYAKYEPAEETILVYDLGGGTFDVSLLRVRQGLVEVLSSGGEPWLGGADFDERVASHIADRFYELHGIDLRDNAATMRRLRLAAEQAKITLSDEEETTVRLPAAFVREEHVVDLEVPLTRPELERLCAPLIDRTLGSVLMCVGRAGVQTDEIDEVLLIGGQSKMPAVATRLSTLFGRVTLGSVDPDMGVAIGAATRGRGFHILVDVVTTPIGVTLPGAGPHEVFGHGTPLPCTRVVKLERPMAGRALKAELYENASGVEPDTLGHLTIPADWLAGHAGEIELRLRLDHDWTLAATAVCGEVELELEAVPPEQAVAASVGGAPAWEVSRSDDRAPHVIGVSVRHDGRGEFQPRVTENLSRGGMFVRAESSPEVGTLAEVVVDHQGQPIVLVGRVVHVRRHANEEGQPGFGVRSRGSGATPSAPTATCSTAWRSRRPSATRTRSSSTPSGCASSTRA